MLIRGAVKNRGACSKTGHPNRDPQQERDTLDQAQAHPTLGPSLSNVGQVKRT